MRRPGRPLGHYKTDKIVRPKEAINWYNFVTRSGGGGGGDSAGLTGCLL